MGRGTCIVGGGLAGIRAALDIAQAGGRVHLIEPGPFLGGPAAIEGTPGRDGGLSLSHRLAPVLLEALSHPRITVRTLTEVLRAEGGPGDYLISLRSRPRYIDAERCTGCGQCYLACPVELRDEGPEAWPRKPIGPAHPRAVPYAYGIRKEARAPCVQGCPAHVNIQGYAALISRGRYKEALALIRERLPLPSICGRVCFHPCEQACNRGQVDEPVAINNLKRFVAEFDYGDEALVPRRIEATGPRAAIVGSGPAGLACAHDLLLRGYRPTVLEALPQPGGMLRVGIVPYRLPREVLDRDIDYLVRLGVEIRTGVAIGKEKGIDGLFAEGYEAVFLATGAHRARQLRIPGEELRGVIDGITFLREVNLTGGAAVGREVLVIGGGNVALDCARAAVRLTEGRVTCVSLESREEMPAHTWEVEEALEEGIAHLGRLGPKRILGEEGRVTGIETLKVRSVFDPDGRFNPTFYPGTESLLRCDTVIVAIGQAADLGYLSPAQGVEIAARGTIAVDPATGSTSRPGVFAGGDAASGPATVIDAIAAGKQAALSIDLFLRGQAPANEGWSPARDTASAEGFVIPEGVERAPRRRPPMAPPAERVRGFAEVEGALSPEDARAEALRCLACGVCAECGACERACGVPGTIRHEEGAREEEISAGALVWAAEGPLPGWEVEGVVVVEEGDGGAGAEVQRGSAAAYEVLHLLGVEASSSAVPGARGGEEGGVRVGVFLCACGGSIGDHVDLEAVTAEARGRRGVERAEVIRYACTPEGAEAIADARRQAGLTRVVLAGCSCCSLGQICVNCTHQRVRQKGRVLPAVGLDPGLVDLLNIREQVAWRHWGDRGTATAKVRALVRGALARAPLLAAGGARRERSPGRVLVVGEGLALLACAEGVQGIGLPTLWVPGAPGAGRSPRAEALLASFLRLGGEVMEGTLLDLERAGGGYRATLLQEGRRVSLEGGVCVLGPEWEGSHLVSDPLLAPLEATAPGLLLSGDGVDSREALRRGRALAARAAALAVGGLALSGPPSPTIQEALCRGCGICVEVCEADALRLEPREAPLPGVARLDAGLCSGCGTCVTWCPTGALRARHSDRDGLVRAVEETLRSPRGWSGPRLLALACHWSHYAGPDLFQAGTEQGPAEVAVLRVTCSGRIDPAVVLAAFREGAEGVLILTCGEEGCHYGFGKRRAREQIAITRDLLPLLGIEAWRLRTGEMAPGEMAPFRKVLAEMARACAGGARVS